MRLTSKVLICAQHVRWPPGRPAYTAKECALTVEPHLWGIRDPNDAHHVSPNGRKPQCVNIAVSVQQGRSGQKISASAAALNMWWKAECSVIVKLVQLLQSQTTAGQKSGNTMQTIKTSCILPRQKTGVTTRSALCAAMYLTRTNLRSLALRNVQKSADASNKNPLIKNAVRAIVRKRDEMKDQRIQVRLSSELKAKLEALAKAEHRTISNYVEMLLQEHVEKKEG